MNGPPFRRNSICHADLSAGLTTEQKKQKICEYVVNNCLSFRHAEDPILQELLGIHMTAEQTRDRVVEMGISILGKIKKILAKADDIVIAFDEWNDA
jgi:hypothetical protein